MTRRFVVLVLMLAGWLVTGCGLIAGPTTPTSPQSPRSTAAPDTGEPDGVAQAFLSAWPQGDYEGMYSLLSTNSQATYALDDFTTTYQNASQTMGLISLDVTPNSALPSTGTTAEFAFHVVYHTGMLGDISQDLTMRLVLENNRWGVLWTPALIFPQLANNNTLQLQVEQPARANIYDRNGLWLVSSNASAVKLNIIPGQISQSNEDDMLQMLSEMLRMPPDEIKQNYDAAPPDWTVALGVVDLETFNAYRAKFDSYPGLTAEEQTGRRYFDVLAPHVMGYATYIQPDQLDTYKAQGYTGSEIIGQTGLEKWGEQYLAGRPSAVLNAYTSSGQFFGVIAQRAAVPAQSLYTTIDRNLQIIVQDAIEEAYREGKNTWAPTAGGASVVVLDVSNGDVLAMYSYPSYDPNVLYPTNNHPLATGNYFADLLNSPLKPLVDRVTQGTYPPGSIFKIVSLATALQSGLFTKNSTYTCTGVWDELGTQSERYDWKEGGHGTLTLPQGLMASCNPWFYHIGLVTGQKDFNLLPDIARQFGFGQDAGLELDEQPGLIPDPNWLMSTRGEQWTLNNSVNMAIGQGDVQVTPLQVANMIATVANGGTVYQPQFVDHIGLIGEPPSWTAQPVVLGQVSISPENLAIIREAMRGVATDQQIGTAEWRLGSMQIAVAGKTGTAQAGSGGTPHAWFGGFVPYDKPEIAIVVMVENGGEGSVVAAPIFRRIVEKWYNLRVLPYPPDWGNPDTFSYPSAIPGE